jgi:hypothetical protein
VSQVRDNVGPLVLAASRLSSRLRLTNQRKPVRRPACRQDCRPHAVVLKMHSIAAALTLALGLTAVGVVAALLLARYMKTILYGVSEFDPWIYAAVTPGVTCARCWLPVFPRAGLRESIQRLRCSRIDHAL